MSRNPFDDVGKAREGLPQSFQAAITSADKNAEEAVKRTHGSMASRSASSIKQLIRSPVGRGRFNGKYFARR